MGHRKVPLEKEIEILKRKKKGQKNSLSMWVGEFFFFFSIKPEIY